MDNLKLITSTCLTCTRCGLALQNFAGALSATDEKVVARYAMHAALCPDVRIESYIAEVFLNVGDGALWSRFYRQFGLGKVVPFGSEETIEEVCQVLADSALQRLQAALGTIAIPNEFRWQERPTFRAWLKPGNRSLHVALWFGFGIVGWKPGRSLSAFLGRDAASLSEIERGEGEGVFYL